ncbi:translation initiation factor IF-2 [Treponema sp.]|uniref:translation initiation factor IF-2 n=1 Tax=Treponema sp. TaxID=166 RepID=UPI00388EC500
MAEESEKKTILIKHSKANDAQPAAEPTKKKIVIKRKAPSAAGSGSGDGSKPEQKKRVVVQKKHNDAPAKSEEVKSAASSTTDAATEKTVQQQASAASPRSQAQTLEFPSTRPNVKAGNLSGGNRGGYNGGYNRGQGGYNGGYNRNNNGGQGGFTGAQAREGYQNRERQGGYNNRGNYNNNGGQGGYNRGGYNNNGQGGYNRGGYNNNNGGQGGYNRGPNGQGGYNRGPNGQGGGYNRGPNGQSGGFNRGPGFGGSRPGFGGGRPGFGAPSAVPTPDRTPGKKQFKGKKQVYNRKDKEELFDEDELYGNKKHEVTPASVVPETIDIMETVSVSDLAKKMNLKASEIIGKLFSMGMMVTINQSIDSDTATLLADEYNCKVHLVSLYDETVIASDEGSSEGERPRPPVVTVMGHVDHGKTKTLDAIRDENVAAGEAGGITQKIGAYQVRTKDGQDITFLDTPGHEAFTMMRARGAQITDIVVLVVAADDGVMPQTMEAINHAKDAKVPIIVAVNKCDKPDANPENVMTQLSNLGLTPEAWGGDTQFVNISALKRQGIDDLLDAILIQAEMLELKAQYDCRAEGKVIESRTDQGRGVVASVVVERGTLHIGDPLVAGIYSGRVRALFNDRGQKIKEATPSMPVEVLGLESMPNAGDPIQVTENEKDARAFAAKRQELKRFEAAKAVKKITLDNMFDELDSREVKELKIIIKADLQGSAEALKTSLEKLSTKEIRVNVIHSSAGAINESDVTLAAADQNAIIIGFNVRPTPKAKELADQEKVEIRKYNIIYKCVEEIQQAMEGMLSPDTKEETTGTAEVRNTFKVPKVGVIAGCYVTEGFIKRTCSVNLIRDGVVIFTGKISSLKRFKDDAKEVKDGFECGIGLENWQDIQVGDQIEAFEIIEVKRSLGKTLAEEQAEAEKKAATTSETAE